MTVERSPTPRTPPGYRLLHLLGRGQTSLVHLAQDPQGRQIALKVPLESTLGQQEAAERFGNEVRLTLHFQHPHLVRGYAGSPFGARAFLAMRHYPEGTLADRLEAQRGRGLAPESALQLLADLASGLTYLHGAGAVHQDVKAQNIYVADGRAALGDLGSTYFTAQGGCSSGSPFYMAPEIYRGEHSSPASDVYSLGILAYELLSGARPYQGDSYEELMAAHLGRFAPPLASLCPGLPRPVARQLELALAKRPGDRPTADALRRILLEALGQPEDPDPSLPPEPEDTAPPRPVGRHGAPPSPSSSTFSTPDNSGDAGKGGGRWNPFKRRK